VEESDIVVCNPATQQRVTLPGHGHRDRSFMPLHLAVSASGHFHVFALLRNHHGSIGGVDIYSSEEGAWSHKEARWDHDVAAPPYRHSVFLHGMLHLVTRSRAIVAVDTKGSRWETIQLLEDMKPKYWSNAFLIGKSQGSLHYVSNGHGEYYCTLSVWMLQGNGEWIHKHRISTQALFRTKYPVVWHHMLNISLVAIHPDRNTIFFAVGDDMKFMSYDMDGKRRGISLVRGLLNCQDDGSDCSPYLPYVPSWRSIPL
jgi:hypothetical protein